MLALSLRMAKSITFYNSINNSALTFLPFALPAYIGFYVQGGWEVQVQPH